MNLVKLESYNQWLSNVGVNVVFISKRHVYVTAACDPLRRTLCRDCHRLRRRSQCTHCMANTLICGDCRASVLWWHFGDEKAVIRRTNKGGGRCRVSQWWDNNSFILVSRRYDTTNWTQDKDLVKVSVYRRMELGVLYVLFTQRTGRGYDGIQQQPNVICDFNL